MGNYNFANHKHLLNSKKENKIYIRIYHNFKVLKLKNFAKFIYMPVDLLFISYLKYYFGIWINFFFNIIASILFGNVVTIF